MSRKTGSVRPLRAQCAQRGSGVLHHSPPAPIAMLGIGGLVGGLQAPAVAIALVAAGGTQGQRVAPVVGAALLDAGGRSSQPKPAILATALVARGTTALLGAVAPRKTCVHVVRTAQGGTPPPPAVGNAQQAGTG